MDYEDEEYSFIECAIAAIWRLGSVVGGLVLTFWVLFLILKPDNYTPPEKSKVKIEQIKTTTPVINHDVTVETNITVSDGVTKRTMKSKVKSDSVTHAMIKTVNDQMLQATYKIVDDRQKEINSDPNYWSRNVISVNKEK